MDSKTEFKIGDVVMLKSETHIKMTIGAYGSEDNDVVCYYFLSGEIKTFVIHKDALRKVG